MSNILNVDRALRVVLMKMFDIEGLVGVNVNEDPRPTKVLMVHAGVL